jgi:hypothetical protein
MIDRSTYPRAATSSMLPLAYLALVAWLGGQPAHATDYDYQLDSTLYVRGLSDRPWINLEDCGEADSVEFLLDWALSSTSSAVWSDTLKADVFLSTAQDCASVSVEIENDADTGDAQIEIDQISGEYPEDDDELFLADITGLNCSGGAEVDYTFCIKWTFEVDESLTTYTYTYYASEPLRFDVSPPAALTLSKVDSGENNLKLTWAEPEEDDIGEFLIQYRVEGEATWRERIELDEDETGHTITGLELGTTYEVRVAAVDTSENVGEFSGIMTGTPQPISDGWEYYKDQGGTESGGFCFVATAAYGSYDGEMVLPLRRFRDEVLVPSEAGRELVACYYQYGPRWARAIRSSDAVRGVARAALLPAVGMAMASELGAVEWLLLAAGLALAAWCLWMCRRALGRLTRRSAVPLVAMGVLAVGLTHAERVSAAEPFAQLQLRGGPHYPDVDAGLATQPFHAIYGGSSRFLFELGADWEFWRPFGAFTLGGTAGFVQFLGKGLTTSGSKSSDTTVFNIVPLKLTLGYHFDVLAERWDIPLVPYIQGGLCYNAWWILNGVGDVSRWTDPGDDSRHEAQGGLWGLHWGIGLKVLLDFLDEEAAGRLETEVGIANTYLFAEYTRSWASNFGTQGHFDVGGDTFMFGLMMELSSPSDVSTGMANQL